MEFVDRFFGIKRRRQAKLLSEMGILSGLKKELIGSELENALVAIVNNNQFLEILKSEKHDRVLSHLVNQSDTHQYHDLYIDIGEGIQIKTGVASVDHDGQRNLFSDLDEMAFKFDPKESKAGWGVYRNEKA